jgi:cytochrome oxidase complex assembly protein 1
VAQPQQHPGVMSDSVSAAPALERRDWWGRNWKWFLPLIGVTGLAMLTAFVAAILWVVVGTMKSSDAYKTAVATAKADARVISALGSPVKEGFFVTGNIHASGPSGEASLAIPISGPKGEGTIYVEATKAVGQWHYSNLVFEVKGTRIDLKEAPALH